MYGLDIFALTEKQLQQFEIYYEYLILENQKMNLTAIVDKEDVYVKHFYDSLLLSKELDFTKVNNICDVGSGAGFPSIPLKIMFPDLRITIIEPTQKRIHFLERLLDKLDIEGVTLLAKRAEDVAFDLKNTFDIVTARAVARLNILAELCIPFVKLNGYFIAMKGQQFEEEVKEAKTALSILGGKLQSINSYMLPNDIGKRAILMVQKEKLHAEKYPRHFSQIKKKPL